MKLLFNLLKLQYIRVIINKVIKSFIIIYINEIKSIILFDENPIKEDYEEETDEIKK